MIHTCHAREVPDDAVIRLLSTQWGDRGWGPAKYDHYYTAYPEGEPLSLVAVHDAGSNRGAVAGHFGLLPVTVAGISGYLALHVLVDPTFRRGMALGRLVRYAEQQARQRGAQFICGFANARFAKVVSRLFHWHVLGYLHFVDVAHLDVAAYCDRLRFAYGEAWFSWKFGCDRAAYLVPYERTGTCHQQLLKTRDVQCVRAADLGVSRLNVWHPQGYASAADEGAWSQPFVLRSLSAGLPERFASIHNWFVEMGDSDTFEPHQPWRATA